MFRKINDTSCNADGNRLKLYWDQGRLNCDNWNWDENSNSNLAVAALMVQRINAKRSRLNRDLYYLKLLLFSQALHPFAEHSSRSRQFLRQLSIFARIQSLCFPEQCYKKFQVIQLAA